MARITLTKKIRFEVFKRDSFTCQYCGNSPPGAVLNVDHIIPVAQNGTNDILNLVTSCFDCNSGKSDRNLSDQSIVKKKMSQAKHISERTEQLKMIAEWQQSLADLKNTELSLYEDFLEKNYDFKLSAFGKANFKKHIKKYGLTEMIEATEKSAHNYLNNLEDQNDRNKFLDYIPKICYWQKRERENPEESQLRKIAYTANKIWWSCNVHIFFNTLLNHHKIDNIPIEVLHEFACSVKCLRDFSAMVDGYLSEME